MARMDRLFVLGSGHAHVTKCYNACFAFTDGIDTMLADAGGGNRILSNLELSGLDVRGIRHVFISHAHTDHILGAVWVVRMFAAAICDGGCTDGLNIYCNHEVADKLTAICGMLVQQPYLACLGDQIRICPVSDGETRRLGSRTVTFFDIKSRGFSQYGFSMELSGGKKVVFLGDEPYVGHEWKYAYGADFLMHEACCLEAEKAAVRPYRHHHGTALDAAAAASALNVKNLMLIHMGDSNMEARKRLYTEEAQGAFHGKVYAPDDLDVITLDDTI